LGGALRPHHAKPPPGAPCSIIEVMMEQSTLIVDPASPDPSTTGSEAPSTPAEQPRFLAELHRDYCPGIPYTRFAKAIRTYCKPFGRKIRRGSGPKQLRYLPSVVEPYATLLNNVIPRDQKTVEVEIDGGTQVYVDPTRVHEVIGMAGVTLNAWFRNDILKLKKLVCHDTSKGATFTDWLNVAEIEAEMERRGLKRDPQPPGTPKPTRRRKITATQIRKAKLARRPASPTAKTIPQLREIERFAKIDERAFRYLVKSRCAPCGPPDCSVAGHPREHYEPADVEREVDDWEELQLADAVRIDQIYVDYKGVRWWMRGMDKSTARNLVAKEKLTEQQAKKLTRDILHDNTGVSEKTVRMEAKKDPKAWIIERRVEGLKVGKPRQYYNGDLTKRLRDTIADFGHAAKAGRQVRSTDALASAPTMNRKESGLPDWMFEKHLRVWFVDPADGKRKQYCRGNRRKNRNTTPYPPTGEFLEAEAEINPRTGKPTSRYRLITSSIQKVKDCQRRPRGMPSDAELLTVALKELAAEGVTPMSESTAQRLIRAKRLIDSDGNTVAGVTPNGINDHFRQVKKYWIKKGFRHLLRFNALGYEKPGRDVVWDDEGAWLPLRPEAVTYGRFHSFGAMTQYFAHSDYGGLGKSLPFLADEQNPDGRPIRCKRVRLPRKPWRDKKGATNQGLVWAAFEPDLRKNAEATEAGKAGWELPPRPKELPKPAGSQPTAITDLPRPAPQPKKRGRKPEYDIAQDRRIVEAVKTRRLRSVVAAEFGITVDQVKEATDRHRKRIESVNRD
jgi:hypothetical protein